MNVSITMCCHVSLCNHSAPPLPQVSPNSTVQPYSLAVQVQPVPSLPFRPQALLRWAMYRHGSLSSLTHTARANRVYVRVGEGEPARNTHTHTHIQLIHDSGLSDLLSPSPTKSPLCLPDTTMPRVCQLQSLFLSHNYLTSDLQPQEVQGCAPVGGGDPEVHVIKLHSAGSGLCG